LTFEELTQKRIVVTRGSFDTLEKRAGGVGQPPIAEIVQCTLPTANY
jgi:hypothetical protein